MDRLSEVNSSTEEHNPNNVNDMVKQKIIFDIVSVPDMNHLVESIANCKKPLCDDADLECVINMVDATICEAIAIIESDPRGLFCYKYPKNQYFFGIDPLNLEIPVSMTDNSNSSDFVMRWLTIDQFEYSNAIAMIRDYIGMWQLSPKTQCVVLTNTRRHEVAPKGNIYFVDAHFSRPTPRCPNPLAVAKVRFIITVSSILQRHYPVMITYRFEGFRTLYYALGERAINSSSFQRFYIDTILHNKLSFFAELCECRHGTIAKPKDIANTTRPKRTA